eukprot:297911_1
MKLILILLAFIISLLRTESAGCADMNGCANRDKCKKSNLCKWQEARCLCNNAPRRDQQAALEEQYSNRLAEFYYDEQVEAAREEKAERILHSEKKALLKLQKQKSEY